MTVPAPDGVVTPEAVPLELQYANLGSRSVGLAIDLLIQVAAAVLLFLGLAALLDAAGTSGGLAVAALLLLLFLIIWGYPVILETLWRGRTVGKAAFGLRVVTTEGAPVGFRHAAIRATLGLVDFYLTWGAAAVLSVLLTRRNQRLGDLVAGTLVLRERTGLPPVSAVGFAVPWGMEAYAGLLDVAGLRPDDYRAVRAFLMRAASLPPHIRADLAVQLADPLASRVRPPPPAGTVPELFLACVAAVYQHRQRGQPVVAVHDGPAVAPPPPVLSLSPPPPPPPPVLSPTPPPPPAGDDGFAPPA